jgi:general L-amino acid transport system permease protein
MTALVDTAVTTNPGPRGSGFRLFRRAGTAVLAAQVALIGGLVALAAVLGWNLTANMHRLGLTPGFAFLAHAANFEIGEGVFSYAAGDSYARAIAVGLGNTIRVAVIGCVATTIIGVALGIARLSTNPLLSRAVQAYVEVIRNTPLLLQLFFWSATIRALPGPRQALQPIPGIYLSNRGLFLPGIADGGLVVLTTIGALVLALALLRRLAQTGRPVGSRTALGLLAVAILLPVGIGWLADALPVIEAPALRGFNIVGGAALSPEFVVITVGLVVNASASVAEIVRSGIQSVPSGQWEAARSLGLRPGQIMRHVVLPQALRVIIPVMTSTYLSLTKNSSLAVAIGYPDLVSILNTSANTTGQALEAIILMMGTYLTLSLIVSAGMNAYNRRVVLRERRR